VKIKSLLFSCALLLVRATEAHSATVSVTNTNDSGRGSFRQALINANDGDTITFAVSGTITLTSGGLPITKNLTISGPGADQLSIDGNQALLGLGVFPDKTAIISGLSVKNGQVGIWNEGTLAISNCVLSGSSADGVYNHGTLEASNCVFSGNAYDGLYSLGISTISNCVVSGNAYGGLFNDVVHEPNDRVAGYDMTIADSIINDNLGPGVLNYGLVTILNSTLSGNSAGQFVDGGGISSGTFKAPASVTVMNSTISGNSASGAGGGIANYYWGVTILNSTISGNSAQDGGGIENFEGGVQVANSSISGNSAASGGGIENVAGQFGGTIETGNTIFNTGASGENIFNNGGTVTSDGYNVCSDDGGGYLNGPGDQINIDPLLGPLQDNGGPTLTHLPLPGSPAIDAGDPNFTPPPLRDQRGVCFYRIFGRRIDVGSVETQPEPRCPTPAPRPTP
jgi:hypothetical protein